jgi:hypothetical protein
MLRPGVGSAGGRRRAVVCLALLHVLAGCGADARSDGPVVRDSAGVRIVEYAALPADLPRWAVEDSPAVRIGAIDGDAPYVFGRVASVAGRSDGVIIVADAQALEVRAFDARGSHLWSAGTEGAGPGELRSVELAAVVGDSIRLVDGRQARVLVFDGTGRFARQFELPPAAEQESRPRVLGALPNGVFALSFARGPDGSLEEGRHRGTLRLALFSGDEDEPRSFAELASTEQVVVLPAAGLVEQGNAIWGRRTQVAVGGGAIAATAQDRFDVARYDDAGAPDLIVRVDAPALVVDAAVRDRFADAGIAAGIMVPDTLPAIGRIRLDAERRLWVEEYVAPYEDRPPVWWVFDAEGVAIAVATVPPSFTIHELADDRALGVALDSLDVPYVEVRRIRRP